MLLHDAEIAKVCSDLDVFMPYVGEKRRCLESGVKAISYGLSQAGYDLRLSPEQFLVYDKRHHKGAISLDPKNQIPGTDFTVVHDSGSTFFRLPPHSFALGTSLEKITMPDNVIGLCDGKSTYARCGIIINVTPIEPGWTGHLTIHIANPTPFPVRIYANEGIVQVMLYKLSSNVDRPYSGNYQNQSSRVQLAAV